MKTRGIEILHAPRRMGKTTEALRILREDPNSILICHIGNRSMQLSHENKELDHRIFSAYSPKGKVLCRGLKLQHIIIDDGDCINLSLLLEWINYCMEKNLNLTITTTE